MSALLTLGLVNAGLAALLALGVAAAWPLWRRRPALAHGLWLLVLLKLLTPSVIPVTLPWPGPAPEPVESAAPGVVLPAEFAAAAPEPSTPLIVQPAGWFDLPVLEGPAPPDDVPAGIAWTAGLLMVWLAGSLLWWGLACWRIVRFRRLLRWAVPAAPEVQALARELAGRLGLRGAPAVALVSAPVSPMLWALGPVPRILLPAELWNRLGAQGQRALLAHEMAHLRRRDHWVRWLELAALGLYWWHPAAWWACRQLHAAEEACCDAWVVWALPGLAPAYAQALVETLAFLSCSRATLPAAASGAGQVRTLKRRLTMILRESPPRSLSVPGLTALVLGLGLLPILPSLAGGADEDQTPAPAPAKSEERPRVKKAVPPVLRPDPPLLPEGSDRAGARNKALEADRAAEVDKVKDEIELLEAQLATKQAMVEAARAALDAAGKRRDRLSRLHAQGTVSAGELEAVTERIATLQAELRIKEAELREPAIRLRQARRRLESFQRQLAAPRIGLAPHVHFKFSQYGLGKVQRGKTITADFTLANDSPEAVEITGVRTTCACLKARVQHKRLQPGQRTLVFTEMDAGRFEGKKQMDVNVAFTTAGGKAGEARLSIFANSQDNVAQDKGPRTMQDLENKLDALQKEMEQLRQQLRRQSSVGPNAGDILAVHERQLKIPVAVDPSRKGVKGLVLYVSRDKGQTWRLAAVNRPAGKAFDFTAPEDGLYWFSVDVLEGNGVVDRLDGRNRTASLKVLVDTAGR